MKVDNDFIFKETKLSKLLEKKDYKSLIDNLVKKSDNPFVFVKGNTNANRNTY